MKKNNEVIQDEMGAAVKAGKTTDQCPAFQLIRSQRIDSLKVTVEEYQHIKTGAIHFHLAANNPENVFLVALRTVPMDSTGVAHILEHTALCGSERYPVRDPFFMMIRRSLNTFMNAFTSSDWTAYPFASKNKKDFFNLMDVYLDAVFFSRLDELDFAQEGHRVEFEDPKNPDTDLQFKGVVFNEMKGAMSSPVSTLWQKLTSNLYPTTTYHYNSGGEPENIPDLGYEQLKSFYKTHYHPSNAVFMTYGNISAAEHQKRIDENALSRFDKLDVFIGVEDEVRYPKPKIIEDVYALDENDMEGNKTHIVVSWLLGKSTNLEEQIMAHFLSSVLLDNASSPLRYALETTDLGSAPSPLCGVEDSNREMCFVCGIEGSVPENADKLESLVLNVLNEIVKNGVPQDQLESALHQLELHQREITGDGYPYGLHLILGGLSSAIHRGDPVAVLNIDPVLELLRERIKDHNFIKDLVKDLLLNNQHRVRLTLKPDAELNHLLKTQEEDRLSQLKEKMSESDKKNVILLSEKLARRQTQEDNPEILPKVGLDDVPPKMEIIEGESSATNDIPLTIFNQGTNGLAYQQIVVKMPDLADELIQVLPYFTTCMTELGCGELDYLETQAWQDRVSGGINAYTSIRSEISDVQNVDSYFVLSGKALSRNYDSLLTLMAQTFSAIRFDEHPRIREIIAQQRAGREQSVTGNGHMLAMTAAASGISPVAALSHRLRGLSGIKHIKQLDDELKSDKAIKDFSEKLVQIHSSLLSSPKQLLLVSEEEFHSDFQNQLGNVFGDFQSKDERFTKFSLEPIHKIVKQAWTTSTQVNFCAKAYPTVTMEHPDAATLAVLGGFLRNGYLHRAIREQGGAYGGGASHDSDSASFRFYSYRDPRLTETLTDFDQSIEWLLSEKHEWRQVEEAILGVIGKMDKPGSPAGDAKESFYNRLFGRTPEKRQLFRERVLSVSLDDLQRVGEQYLTPDKASVAVICSTEKESECEDQGLEVVTL